MATIQFAWPHLWRAWWRSAALWLLVLAGDAGAQPVLNGSVPAKYFSITTFASGFALSGDTCACGPTGLASTSDGNILVADYLGHTYVFRDVDGQRVSDALRFQTPFTHNGSTPSLAYLGGTTYLARDRTLYAMNANGSVAALLLGGAQVTSGGLAASDIAGRLYANSNIDPGHNIASIDPVAQTVSLHPGPGGFAGSVSLDGSTLFITHYPNVQAFDTATFDVRWVSTVFATSVVTLPTGPLTGSVLGYDATVGNLTLMDPLTGAATIIATGGPTGNGLLLSIDSNNGSAFLTAGSTIYRVAAVPEPHEWLMLGVGVVAVVGAARRRRRCGGW